MSNHDLSAANKPAHNGVWNNPSILQDIGNIRSNDPHTDLNSKTIIASPNAAENVVRANQSRWAEVADLAKAEYKSPAQASEMSALDVMRNGNGSGFAAQRPAFAHTARRYEWRDEYGDVGPEVPELERELFDDMYINRIGDAFGDMVIGGNVQVSIESEEKINPVFKWEDAGLHPIMLDNIKKCRYAQPTAIQGYCIPAVLTGHDLIAISHTGSGKTAAYLIPALSKLLGKIKKLGAGRPAKRGEDFDPMLDGICAEPLILIVVPTRELAVQIFDDARKLCYRSMLRPCAIYGGGPIREQIYDLRRACDLLVATPGRLVDFMQRPGLLSLSRVRYTIIDEADEMVSEEWQEQLSTIMGGTDDNNDADHRYMMFSATFPRGARALAKRHLAEDHIRIRIGRVGAAHRHVAQSVIWVENMHKNQAVLDLLLAMPPARSLVFVNSKDTCDRVDDFLYHSGLPSTSIHSGRTQGERESALKGFRDGSTPILVATGVSARGLDVFNVMHVINYDLPSSQHGGIHDYVHRIGRTARIGNVGSATAFYNDRNEDIAQDLVNVLVDCGQAVPDFLEHLKPLDGQKPDFADDDSQDGDDENPIENAGGGSNDGWTGAVQHENADQSWDSTKAAETVADDDDDEGW